MGSEVEIDTRFEAFLMDIDSDMPPELLDQIKTGLRKKFETPPVATLESSLKRAVTVEKVGVHDSCSPATPPHTTPNYPQLFPFDCMRSMQSTCYEVPGKECMEHLHGQLPRITMHNVQGYGFFMVAQTGRV